MILEVCAFNIQSCFIAERAGAGRIELCADPLQGGTTPSHGTIAYALEHISIPIFPMIRPRGGDFVYGPEELEIMKRDIAICKQLGCPGIATGVLLADGTIDLENLKRIVAWAYPMQVTCHKAFDAVPDALEALEAVIAAGCSRILSSGLQPSALEGSVTLKNLIAAAADRIIIMPGGGVRAANIAQLADATGAVEFHSAALINKKTDTTANEAEVRGLVAALQECN